MNGNNTLRSLALVGLLATYGGCADSNSAPTPSGRGNLELRLVDAPADDVKEIVVTITRVEAHVAGGGGWMVLAEKTATIDLLKLQGGSFVQLGVAQFPGGKITQLRLYVKEDGPNYVTTPDGQQHHLTVPSGPESGIKIKGGFDWAACDSGNLTLDFDGKKSIFVHPKGAGAGDEWLLRPVVRLKSVSVTGDACMMPPAPLPPDAGAPIDPPMQPDPGTMTPPADPMTPPADPMTPPPPPPSPPVMPPPAGDPCGDVVCPDGSFCYNGGCISNIE
jgi:hypothetical protein